MLSKKETEYKKLKEADDLKRKRIVQLESEIALANESLLMNAEPLKRSAEHNSPDLTETRIQQVEIITKQLQEKFESLSKNMKEIADRNTRSEEVYFQTETDYTYPCFPCDLCNYQAISDRDLTRHKNTMHSIPYSCRKCGKEFNDIYILREHLREDHRPTRSFYSNRRHVPYNKQKSNPLVNHRSKEPASSTPAQASIRPHDQIPKDAKRKCEDCGHVFRHEDEQSLHMEYFHGSSQ